ncbi:hypothetical protein LAZ29_03075 [Cereibacter sphaeroides]|uniref:hypothetical protein n=1 Tax=Cereibacter sphaeroides TaxID=1063 RepID=UPI001F1CC5B0|nr:hypothetical protein [Cereibacter sphaeroides]MCE6949907.1 hypothetical protein [Cereibacter sphaeroides]
MYLPKEARSDETPDQAPPARDIDLEAVTRYLDQQADEDRRVPVAFWFVMAAGLVILSPLLLVLF